MAIATRRRRHHSSIFSLKTEQNELQIRFRIHVLLKHQVEKCIGSSALQGGACRFPFRSSGCFLPNQLDCPAKLSPHYFCPILLRPGAIL